MSESEPETPTHGGGASESDMEPEVPGAVLTQIPALQQYLDRLAGLVGEALLLQQQEAARMAVPGAGAEAMRQAILEHVAIGQAKQAKVEEFVRAFVPLDLTEAELQQFLQQMVAADDAETQFRNLGAELIALSGGAGVEKIKESGADVCFFFRHPLVENCDRECVFEFRSGEWRAQG